MGLLELENEAEAETVVVCQEASMFELKNIKIKKTAPALSGVLDLHGI